VNVPGTGRVAVAGYDARGRLVSSSTSPTGKVRVAIPARGFAFVTR
jgi:hypothetical protein